MNYTITNPNTFDVISVSESELRVHQELKFAETINDTDTVKECVDWFEENNPKLYRQIYDEETIKNRNELIGNPNVGFDIEEEKRKETASSSLAEQLMAELNKKDSPKQEEKKEELSAKDKYLQDFINNNQPKPKSTDLKI